MILEQEATRSPEPNVLLGSRVRGGLGARSSPQTGRSSRVGYSQGPAWNGGSLEVGARHLHGIGNLGSEGATQASSNEMISRLDLSDRRST